MSTAWAFFFLAVLLVASGGALARGAALVRKRSHEEFILQKSKRAGGKQ